MCIWDSGIGARTPFIERAMEVFVIQGEELLDCTFRVCGLIRPVRIGSGEMRARRWVTRFAVVPAGHDVAGLENLEPT